MDPMFPLQEMVRRYVLGCPIGTDSFVIFWLPPKQSGHVVIRITVTFKYCSHTTSGSTFCIHAWYFEYVDVPLENIPQHQQLPTITWTSNWAMFNLLIDWKRCREWHRERTTFMLWWNGFNRSLFQIFCPR